jgi:protein-S-isoprenylcysteine O-methyltransferase Ste14
MIQMIKLFPWIGGALFVASLAATAFVYFVSWGVPGATGGTGAIAIDAVLVSIFAFHHSLFARESVKALLARALPEELLRSIYVWTASLLLLIVLALWQPVAGTVYHVTSWRLYLHALVQFAGVGVIARAVAKIDPLELAGITPPPTTAGPAALQVGGVYKWVRHPLYLGWVLALFGAANMTANRLTFACITTAYLVVAIPWEERSLERFFGESYTRYRREVPWRVIPYIY